MAPEARAAKGSTLSGVMLWCYSCSGFAPLEVAADRAAPEAVKTGRTRQDRR